MTLVLTIALFVVFVLVAYGIGLYVGGQRGAINMLAVLMMRGYVSQAELDQLNRELNK